MKALKIYIPFMVVGFIVYNFIDSESEVVEQNVAPAQSIVSYGERGAANDWPKIDEDFSSIISDVSRVNYYLVLDGSGSMEDTGCSNGQQKLQVAKQSLKSFVAKLPAGANVGLFAFDKRGIGERMPLGTNNAQQLGRVIDGIQAGGGTPLSLAIDAGNEALTKQAKSQLGYGEYHLVIVTDGEANSGYEPDAPVQKLLESSPIVLHTVGFCISNQHSLNQPGYTLYKSADDPDSLTAGLEAVLAEAPDFSLSDFPDEK